MINWYKFAVFVYASILSYCIVQYLRVGESKIEGEMRSSKNTNRDILTQTASCNIYLSVTNVCIYSQFYDKILLSSTPTGAI